MALDRLDLLPRHGHDQGVGVHVGDGRPHLGQGCGIVAGIVGLAGQHQEGRAVDHEGGLAGLVHDLRHGGRRGFTMRRLGTACHQARRQQQPHTA